MELLVLLLLLLLSPAACSSNSNPIYNNKNWYECDWCPRHSTASLFPPNYKNKNGGGGSLVHHLAAGSADLFRDGGAACYQLRCRDRRRLCADDGVKVAVTEKTKTNGTGFLLTRDAFTAMMSSDQLAARLHQVEFRRIPCEYKKNLAVRVEVEQQGNNNKSRHLGVRFLYQGGLTDIAAVEIAQQQGWRSMARHRTKQGGGVVWRTHLIRSPVADDPLQLRLVVTAGSGGKWLRTALPAGWRHGGVYDTGLQITDVAVRVCRRSCRLATGSSSKAYNGTSQAIQRNSL